MLSAPFNVLVVGAYGFIGQAIVRALLHRGHMVTGLGRSRAVGRRAVPAINWLEANLTALGEAADWHSILDGIDVVVNASGALQDGARDNLRATQERAIKALADACLEGSVQRLVQISAPGADTNASTRFLRTKARADRYLLDCGLDCVVLRPGLVIGNEAYGGTALLHALAALPLIQPLIFPHAQIQCVDLDEVAEVACRAVEGALPAGITLDLVEVQPHSLRQIVTAFANAFGHSQQVPVDVPNWVGSLVSKFANALGWLGWRSPLRQTALQNLRDGVYGNASGAIQQLGKPLSSLEQILARRPLTLQDRRAARLYLMLPLVIAVLSLFWIASGVIALMDVGRAAAVLPPSMAGSAWVVSGGIVDIALGAAVLFRPWARWACFGMAFVTVAYLVGGTLFTPHLWLDPLGPLLKALPAMVLALVTPTLLMER